MLRINAHFIDSIDTDGAGRENFADPIRGDGKAVLFRRRCQSFFSPSCQIKHQDIVSKMDFRFVVDDPSTWPPATKTIRRDQFTAHEAAAVSVS